MGLFTTLFALWCFAVTAYGARSASTRRVYSVTAKEIKTNSALIEWKLGEMNQTGNTNYRPHCQLEKVIVRYRSIAAPKRTFRRRVVGTNKLRLRQLKPATTYTVLIRGVDCYGRRHNIPSFRFQTSDDSETNGVLPGPVRELRRRVSSSTIILSWLPPENAKEADIRTYMVNYGLGIVPNQRLVLNAGARTATLDSLRPGAQYIIRVVAVGAFGRGRSVTALAYTREEPVPEVLPLTPPIKLQAIVLSSASVFTAWVDPSLGPSQRLPSHVKHHYQVSVREVGGEQKVHNVVSLNSMFDDLKPGTTYEFMVRVVRLNRTSAWSIGVQNKTFEAVPSSPPVNISLELQHEGQRVCVQLDWEPPKQPNGIITNYLVHYTEADTGIKNSRPHWTTMATVNTSYLACGFTFNKPVRFKIRAINNIGRGPASEIVQFTPTLKSTSPTSKSGQLNISPFNETSRPVVNESLVVNETMVLNVTDEPTVPGNEDYWNTTSDQSHSGYNSNNHSRFESRLMSPLVASHVVTHHVTVAISWHEIRPSDDVMRGEREYTVNYQRNNRSEWQTKYVRGTLTVLDCLESGQVYQVVIKPTSGGNWAHKMTVKT